MTAAIKASLLGGLRVSPSTTLRGRVLTAAERRTMDALRVTFNRICQESK